MNMQTKPSLDVTRQMGNWIASFDGDAPEARIWARHVLLDWLTVTIAGATAENVQILREAYPAPGNCHLIGAKGETRRAEDAALINGTAGHVLDYDDASVMVNGHATAPVAPAILALAEELGSSGGDIIEAMIIGQEVEVHLGQMMAPEHYQSGYHATTTIGTIGAAAAAARLFRLTAEQAAHALGLAATQAAGLKSMFGSMTKSFQVGKAAMNGIISARLAKAGFAASPDGLECPQGMGPVMSQSFTPAPFAPGQMERWGVAYNAFKYHGACFFTHSAIEAANLIRAKGVALSDLASMVIDINPAVLTMCDQPEPKTGLEAKFSVRHLAVAGLRGDKTADSACYCDAFANDPALMEARKKVSLNAPPEHKDLLVSAKLTVTTTSGETFKQWHDVGELATDTNAQWQKLCTKTHNMLPKSQAEALIAAVYTLESAPDIADLQMSFRSHM